MFFEQLRKLILLMQALHSECCASWKASEAYVPINQKKQQVRDIVGDGAMMEVLFAYHNHIQHLEPDVEAHLSAFPFPVNHRVKNWNSMEDKLGRYQNGPSEGKMPLNKCLNDLFGWRIISADVPDYEQIQSYLAKEFPGLKCIDSSKQGYRATHIYISRSNFDFQWELQLWNARDEHSNKESHKQHKQGYTAWERQ